MAYAMTNDDTQSEKLASRQYGRKVLACLIGFFIVFCSVDVFFVYKAVKTGSGETRNSYEQGLNYNQFLDKAGAQSEMNIEARAAYRKGHLSLTLQDGQGRPFDKATVKAYIRRPVHEGMDFSADLQQTAPGHYETQLNLPAKGLWTAGLDAQWQDKQQARHYLTETTFTAE